jgi:hypothetical protein
MMMYVGLLGLNNEWSTDAVSSCVFFVTLFSKIMVVEFNEAEVSLSIQSMKIEIDAVDRQKTG